MNPQVKLTILICALFLFVTQAASGQSTNFYLKDGDKVVFYGDSITEQSFYTNFIETYVVTRFPKLNVSFVNAGWGGDKIYGGGGGTIDERLRRDVFPHKPTVMTAMFGMNDGCYIEFNADCYKVYTQGYERFLLLLKKDLPQLRLTLLQPSPFDDWTDSNAWRLAPPVKSGYNNVLVRYGQFVEDLAQKNKLNTADMNSPLVEIIRKAQTTDRELAQKIIPDRIHPSEAGGLLMANVLLKAWNAPAVVSKVELDADGKLSPKAENTKIADLRIDKKVSWTQTDESLPLPVDLSDKTLSLIVRLSDVIESLNEQTLKIVNLNAANYPKRCNLKIDGESIGVFTKEELAKGVNLAVFPTPMLKQALEVYKLTQQHNRIHFVRRREMQVPFEKENITGISKAISTLDAMEAEIVKKQRTAAQPKTRRYELIPQN